MAAYALQIEENKVPEGTLRGQRWFLEYHGVHLEKTEPHPEFPLVGKVIDGFHMCHEIAPSTGTPHTHVLIKFQKTLGPATVNTLRSKFLIQGHVPTDIKLVLTNEHWDNIFEYIGKEDPAPLRWGKGKYKEAKVPGAIQLMDLLTAHTHKTFPEALRCRECSPLISSRFSYARDLFMALPKPARGLPDIVYQPWQEQVLQILQAPAVTRTVLWIHSIASRTGKSTFVNSLRGKFSVLSVTGKLQDIFNAMINEEPDILHLNLVRGAELEHYARMLEELSDHGEKLNTKYQGRKFYWGGHLLVTTNHSPSEMEALLPGRLLPIEATPLPDVAAVLPGQVQQAPPQLPEPAAPPDSYPAWLQFP